MPLPDEAEMVLNTGGKFNGIQLFAANSAELIAALEVIYPLLNNNAVFWIIYLKKNSATDTDLNMTSICDEPARYGLRPVASISVNDSYTALRFKPAELVKVSEGRNDGIRGNDYSTYIDIDNKTVTLPDYVIDLLEQHPGAFAFFNQLSYSNQKEYVLWILTAKQLKTRDERLQKMAIMLLAKKKNPADKL